MGKLLRRIFDYLTKPKCQRPGECCQFDRVRSVEPSFKNRLRHDILYYGKPISGSPNGGFYFGMLIPHEVACKSCGRPFRIGDPLPEGAQFDYWDWSPGIRQRPDYLSEERWNELDTSMYFGIRGHHKV